LLIIATSFHENNRFISKNINPFWKFLCLCKMLSDLVDMYKEMVVNNNFSYPNKLVSGKRQECKPSPYGM
jgi:hypothetical protein